MSAARLTPTLCTGSALVVEILERLGGTAPRAQVLAAVSRVRGRREAGCAIGLAVLSGDVENVVLPDGRAGLELTGARR